MIWRLLFLDSCKKATRYVRKLWFFVKFSQGKRKMIQTLASQGFRSKTKLKRIGVHYFLNFVKKHNAFWTEVVYYMEVLKNKPTKVNVFFVSASFVRNVQIRIEVRFCVQIPEEVEHDGAQREIFANTRSKCARTVSQNAQLASVKQNSSKIHFLVQF